MARDEALVLVGMLVAAVGFGLWSIRAGVVAAGVFLALWALLVWETEDR